MKISGGISNYFEVEIPEYTLSIRSNASFLWSSGSTKEFFLLMPHAWYRYFVTLKQYKLYHMHIYFFRIQASVNSVQTIEFDPSIQIKAHLLSSKSGNTFCCAFKELNIVLKLNLNIRFFICINLLQNISTNINRFINYYRAFGISIWYPNILYYYKTCTIS